MDDLIGNFGTKCTDTLQNKDYFCKYTNGLIFPVTYLTITMNITSFFSQLFFCIACLIFMSSCSPSNPAPTEKKVNVSPLSNHEIAAKDDSFEGKMVLSIDFQSLEEDLDEEEDEFLADFLGDQFIYYVKGNQFRVEMNSGLGTITQIYKGGDTTFTLAEGIERVYYNDNEDLDDKILDWAILPSQEIVLGYTCQVLKVEGTKSYAEYYFNDSIKVNPKYFKNFKANYWNFVTEKTASIPLLYYFEDLEEGFAIISEVTELVPMKLDDSLFHIPNWQRTFNTDF